MKKILIAFMLIVVLVSASGCIDYPSYLFDFDRLVDEVVQIQLVYCENDDPQNLEVTSTTVLQFDKKNALVIATLEEKKIAGFLEKLSTTTYQIRNYSVNSPVGLAVVMYKSNGEYIVLSGTRLGDTSYYMASLFNEDGFVKHIAYLADSTSYTMMLSKYFKISK